MPYETDERLKGYLDTNQLRREQMCLAVLAIDRRFTEVRPRHPRGGPDGGRDIDAIFSGAQRAFGAVGFVNQATDSGDHKRAAMRKFRDDLTHALKQQPQPQVFVFLTNVNLTTREKDELVEIALANGIAYAEVFDRERIRILLDGPDGLSIRFQYLDIALSEAEQSTFFARWGQDIQGLITDGFSQIQESLNRIHFLQEATLPLVHLAAVLELDREYDSTEIGHFRAFTVLYLKSPVDGVLGWLFGRTDNSERPLASSTEHLARGRSGIGESICGGQWETRVSEDREVAEKSQRFQPDRGFTSIGLKSTGAIHLRYSRDSLIRLAPEPLLKDTDECMFLFWLNRGLAERVKAIRIFANEYKLIEINQHGFGIDGSSFEPEVPLFFSAAELADPWVRLRPRLASAFTIRFSEQTPTRFFRAAEVPDPYRPPRESRKTMP